MVAAVSTIVVVGGAFGWGAAKYFTGRIADSESVEVRLPPVDATSRGATPPPADARIAVQSTEPSAARPAATPPAQSTSAKTPNAAPPIIVASYSPELTYALSQWSVGKNPSGFLDRAKLGDRVLATRDASKPVARDDVVTLSGWAGDGSIGVRYPYVLISACGRVVAHAVVNLARPDVAKAVHGNLGRSGWRARIAMRHLPECEDLILKAWGVAPGDSGLILSLNGQLALSVAPAVQGADGGSVATAAPPLRRADMKPLPPVLINVTANALNIRRCPGANCPIVGKLSKGEWTVLTLDDSNGWLLVATPDRAGWVSKRYVGVTRRPG